MNWINTKMRLKLTAKLELNRKIGNKEGQAYNLGNIGWNFAELNQHQKAIKANRKAVELFRDLGDKDGQALNLGHVGWYLADLGSTPRCDQG